MDPNKTTEHLKEIIETQSMLALAGFHLQTFMQLVVERMLLLTPATGSVLELIVNDEIVYTAAGGSVAPFVGMKLSMGNSLTGLCVRDREIKISNDTSTDPRVDAAACTRVSAASMVLVPLMRGSEPTGVLKVLSNKTNAFSEDDVDTLQLMAALVGGALAQQLEVDQRNQVEETLVKRTQELEQRNDQLTHVLFELEKAGEELKQKNIQVQEAARLKNEFLANMSHEIRTPMNAIIGFTEILMRADLGPQEKEYLTYIRDAGRGLISLIGDILDFSKIEAGKLTIELIDFDLVKVVEGAVQLLVEQAEAKGLRIEKKIDPRLPNRTVGDPGRLRQILINLLGNAIKFSSSGTIVIEATQKIENADGSVVVYFSVTDQGVGLSEQEIGKLFQPFVQADGSTTRKFGGTGLGLSICKQLVELMDGRIGIESTKGSGAKFWFTLPYQIAKSQEAPMETSMQIRALHAKRAAFASALILVADDHPANQLVAKLQLEKLGLSAHLVSNGLEVLEALKSNKYSAILLDCQMPEMDGYQAAREIRKQEEGAEQHIPIIAMTASAMQSDRDACIAAGMDDYISKPFELEQLREVLDNWLPISIHDRKFIDTPEATRTFAGLERSAVDITPLIRMFGVKSVQKLLTGFTEDTGKSLRALQISLKNQDRAGIQAVTHKLMGSSGTLRANRLHTLSEKLDTAAPTEDWDVLKKLCADVRDESVRVMNESVAFCEREQNKST
jgi:signal transduction histidine kinase/CheY-like chemotaxis protein/HPt (histidine-containing phosphotransfer) domain-containing protein